MQNHTKPEPDAVERREKVWKQVGRRQERQGEPDRPQPRAPAVQDGVKTDHRKDHRKDDTKSTVRSGFHDLAACCPFMRHDFHPDSAAKHFRTIAEPPLVDTHQMVAAGWDGDPSSGASLPPIYLSA